ncbi:MAG: hypothetical protein HYZ75_00800 [Elusimicrobia bacterium]|nr:hypothetical protein [Elusimicrobiota bacterium]
MALTLGTFIRAATGDPASKAEVAGAAQVASGKLQGVLEAKAAKLGTKAGSLVGPGILNALAGASQVKADDRLETFAQEKLGVSLKETKGKAVVAAYAAGALGLGWLLYCAFFKHRR